MRFWEEFASLTTDESSKNYHVFFPVIYIFTCWRWEKQFYVQLEFVESKNKDFSMTFTISFAVNGKSEDLAKVLVEQENCAHSNLPRRIHQYI